ncbi:MAG: DNA-directed RNA polymerase subunit omega [Alphaproteobacteria bacterium]|nr:DNA-directed RNA polymerase subunit omega [Alphaproteobacteria bacterium]MBR6598593.1 DNA-directed RNA polymerase subunit omega [Alphaproteobacteria bacterium]
MARTTNSDTLPYVESRYELGMLASQRVRDLNGGAEPVVDQGNDKLTVLALREIASGKLDVDAVRHEFVQSYKDAPSAEDGEESLEIGTTDPLLREIDAELEDALADDDMPTESAEDVVEDAEESADEE